MPMRIAVVGPGALGCLLAARFFAAGDSRVQLLDHDPQRAALLNTGGIFLDEQSYPVPVTADPAAVGDAELILLTVKAHSFAAALTALTPHLSSRALLLALQNGLSHLEFLQHNPPALPWALGVSTEGATLLAPGRVRSGGSGLTELGFTGPAPSPQAARQLTATVDLFNRAGCQCRQSATIVDALWRKLIINAAINALTVIHDCPNGELLEIAAARPLLAAAAREAASVAAAAGARISEEPVELAAAVCRRTATNISSMLQDVRRGKATEIEAINGAVVRLADRYRLAVPVNRQLYQAVLAKQAFTGTDNLPN